MTIATTSNKVIGQGNGATTNWPFGFKIPDAASLVVIFTDANGVLTTLNSAQYSVAGLGADAGGSVTYPLAGAPIALGTTLTVLRTVAYNQQSSVRNQSGFFPDVYEAALDYLTYQTQQLSEITGRCLQIASTITGVSTTMPAPIASAAIGWNSTATGLANIVVAGTIAVPVGINQGGTGQQTKATAAAALGVVELITAGGTANAQTAAAPANYTAYGLNDIFEYTPAIANTGATQLTITPAGGAALAAKNIFAGGAALVGAELVASVPVILQYDGVQLNIIGGAPFVDTRPLVIGSADATKKIRFEVDGLTTATTRVLTMPDRNLTLGSATWGSQVFTGSGTFTTPATTVASTVFKITVIGAGGGGAGAGASGASGGGGNSGATAVYYITGLTANLACTVTIGAAGTAGTAGANNGGAGGNTSIIVNGVTITANGGTGGQASGSAAAANQAASSTATNGTINISGAQGAIGGPYLATAIPGGGQGAPSTLGGGAAAGPAGNNGQAAVTYGAGGGGGGSAAGTNQAGGAGKDGIIIAEWVI